MAQAMRLHMSRAVIEMHTRILALCQLRDCLPVTMHVWEIIHMHFACDK